MFAVQLALRSSGAMAKSELKFGAQYASANISRLSRLINPGSTFSLSNVSNLALNAASPIQVSFYTTANRSDTPSVILGTLILMDNAWAVVDIFNPSTNTTPIEVNTAFVGTYVSG